MTITNNCFIFYEARGVGREGGGEGVLTASNSTLLVLSLVIFRYKLSNKKVSFQDQKFMFKHKLSIPSRNLFQVVLYVFVT